jgi:hypothetical protein
MHAIINGTAMYTSSDYGVTAFTQVVPSGLPASNLSLIAISGTGLYQIVSTTNILYVSTNTGGTFTSKLSNTNPSITIISSIAVSQTGQYMIACCSSSSIKGYVYYSTNFGENWQIMTALGFDFFNSCAISADGTFFTVSTPSNVYTLNNNLIGNTVAIGNGAGQTNQASNSVAIGNGAGQINQASNTVAIGNGAGQVNQAANTIAINASGKPLNPSMRNGCYIAPIADVSNSTSTFFYLLGYGTDNQVVKSNDVFINGGSVNCRGIGSGTGLLLNGYSTCEIYNTNVDDFRPTGTNNLMIRSWNGIGFPSYDNIVRVAIDTRNGNITATGNITASSIISTGNITASGNITATGNISSTGNITVSGNSSFGNIYAIGRLGVGTSVPSYSLDVNGVARTGSLLTGDITSTGNITAENVFSKYVVILKIPIYSRGHQVVGIRVPTSGVYLVSARAESIGWYNFAILGVNSFGNVFASNTLLPANNVYLNISNYEVTMAIPGGDDWLGDNYTISVTRI